MPQSCGGGGTPNVCGCAAPSCSGKCGSVPNPCTGGTVECGPCPSGQTCGAVTPNVCCQPTTCAALGANCGSPPNGCGGTLSCGACSGNQGCSSSYQCGFAAVASCDGCPGGFNEVASDSCVGGCAIKEAFCVKPGYAHQTPCSASCPPGFHLAYSSTWPCTCGGGTASLCLQN
jgi:hypothetical protein